MDWNNDKVISTGLSIFMIGYIILAKVFERQFRKTAVPVSGKVVKRFPRKHYTSYYVAYHRQDVRRVAEYCGPPMRTLYDEGDNIEILIDPERPPDTAVPGNISWSGSGSGNCSLVGEPVWKLWDFIYLIAAVGVLMYTYR